MKISHAEIPPVYDGNSSVLLLGTMPSPASREAGFYYMHRQNRFWPVLAAVFGEAVPQGLEERKSFALRHGLALWDVLESCDINGASDSSIRNAKPNDIAALIAKTKITRIFCTGTKAYSLYQKLCAPATGIDAQHLPSTSPANAKMSMAELVAAYKSLMFQI
ncbi:MAG: DNA-deoxyinosine glycosylase [Spirochaetaceae bacterium]|jgi:hypoxanthine-DNA glycosylase|nr:DNA-deoxyinosine glycosylase [Spirochaetaceae bacterium]